jgi:hypothetical protein
MVTFGPESAGSSDPAVVTAAFRGLWSVRGIEMGLAVDVSDCPYTAAELSQLAGQRRRPAFLPAELATQADRARLAKLFPLLLSWAVNEDNVVTNDADAWGWFDYETDTAAPHTDLNEAGLRSNAARDDRTLLTLNQYIVASEDNQLASGEYLDQTGSWSRLGSRFDGRAVACRFDGPKPADDLYAEEPAVGCLLVAYDLGSEDLGPSLGGRTSTRVQDVSRASEPRLAYDIARMPVPSVGDLAAERARIIAAFIAVGFHEHLGLDAADYAASFPAIAKQSEQYRGRFDLPLLVETRISWREQAALVGIALGGGQLNLDYVPLNERTAVLPAPYAGWFTWWGQRFDAPITADDARAALADDEVGANLNELIALHVAHPELNEAGRFFEPLGYLLDGSFATGLSGFDDSIVRTACMYRWRGRPEIGANLHPKEFSIFRPLVRGAAVARR